MELSLKEHADDIVQNYDTDQVNDLADIIVQDFLYTNQNWVDEDTIYMKQYINNYLELPKDELDCVHILLAIAFFTVIYILINITTLRNENRALRDSVEKILASK